ncbi:Mth938-like domain-containing protein [Marivivens marinus]|uniref:Mth938-like domain-containing protein n=1 Tax=Marivivens marinus TaxID=3110173 RepID=UPI003B847CCB
MRLNEVVYTDAVPVEGYGPGFFRMGGQVYEGPILVLPNGIAPWDGFEDAAALIAAKDIVDVIFVGTGADMAYLPKGFQADLDAAEVAIEPMASPAACRTYNVLLSEGRRVGLALIPV